MTVDLNVRNFSDAFEELEAPRGNSAADNQAERRHPKYYLRSGLNLSKVWADGKWRGEVYEGRDRYTYYDALVMIKFCQEWTWENDHVGQVPVACHQRATVRSTTHQGYPLTGGPADGYTGNESWLACRWCVDEERIDEVKYGTVGPVRETEYVRLDNGQPY